MSENQDFVTIVLAGNERPMASDANRDLVINRGLQSSLTKLKPNYIPQELELAPWFDHKNNEVEYLMALLTNNSLAPGLISTKCSILGGQGLGLFREYKEGNKIIREPVLFSEVPEIEDFYEYNELPQWTHECFYFRECVGNFFSEMIFSKNKQKVTQIENLLPEFVRAYIPSDGMGRVHKYRVSGAWSALQETNNGVDLTAWDKSIFYNSNRKLIKNNAPKKVLFHGKFRMPNHPFYSVPNWYGARKWLELNNEVPYWHLANLANLFGVRVQILISRANLERMKQGTNPATAKPYTEKEIKQRVAKELTDYLTNPANAGKALVNGYTKDHQGKPVPEFVINPVNIDQKDEAYVKLNPLMNGAVTSSMGVDASLAGMIMDGKLSSGSEKRNAWNIEVMKAANIRNLVLKPLRFIHQYNGWDKTIKWGFKDATLDTTDNEPSGMKTGEDQANNDNQL